MPVMDWDIGMEFILFLIIKYLWEIISLIIFLILVNLHQQEQLLPDNFYLLIMPLIFHQILLIVPLNLLILNNISIWEALSVELMAEVSMLQVKFLNFSFG